MILWFYLASTGIAALLAIGGGLLALNRWLERRRAGNARDDSLRCAGLVLIASSMIPAVYVAVGWKPIFAECSLERVAKNGTVIVRAIDEYSHTHGRPPPTLVALVPEFLPSIPPTGCPAQPDWNYWPCDYAPPNAWGLRVGISGPTMFDSAEIHYAVDRGHGDCEVIKRTADGWTYCMQR